MSHVEQRIVFSVLLIPLRLRIFGQNYLRKGVLGGKCLEVSLVEARYGGGENKEGRRAMPVC